MQLILDETTSALNAEMALQIEKSLLALTDTTVISVSHRIFKENMGGYDEVIRFENGVAVRKNRAGE